MHLVETTLFRSSVDGTVLSPDGALVEIVPLDDPFATNICFGGPDLSTAYITLSSTGRLAEVPWRHKGLALSY